jgi:hypothetical protein
MSDKRENKVTVPLGSDLRAFIEQAAEREDRTMAAQIRHYIAQAARSAAAAVEQQAA